MLDLIRKYRKAVGVLVVTVLTAVASALTDGVTAQEVTVVVGIGLGAIGASIVPNLPTGIGGYAKAVVTFLGGGVAVLAVLIDGGLTAAELIEVVIAACAAVGITVGPRNIGDYRYRQRALVSNAAASLIRATED